MGQPVAPSYTLESYRWRDNVTDPSGVDAAFDGSDTAINTSVTDWEENTQIRLRLLVLQTVATYVNHNNGATEFLLQYDINAAASWPTVGAVGADVEGVQYIAASGFADGDNTGASLLGSGTRVPGDGMEVAGASDTITFTEEAATEAELEFSLELVGANLTDADSITFRLLFSDNNEAPPTTVLAGGSTNVPTITVNVTAPTSDVEWAGTGSYQEMPVWPTDEVVSI